MNIQRGMPGVSTQKSDRFTDRSSFTWLQTGIVFQEDDFEVEFERRPFRWHRGLLRLGLDGFIALNQIAEGFTSLICAQIGLIIKSIRQFVSLRTRLRPRGWEQESDMRIWIFFVIIVWIFAIAGIGNGQEKIKMYQKFFLPLGADGWKWDGKDKKYNSKTIFSYMDGAAELYLAYGFENLTVRRFEQSSQPPITFEFYEMASSEDAYGVFSYEHQDETAGIGQGSEFGGELLRFWKGKYFVSIYAEGQGTEVESGILKIGKAAANSIPSLGSEPKLVGYIPGKELGLIDKSVRYLKSHVLLNQRFFIAHQNILNLNQKTEAVLAQYLEDKQKTQLLLIRYPDSKGAADAYQSFMKAYLPDAVGKDRSKTEDRKWTFARQRNEFVIIIFGASTEAAAEALVKSTEGKLPGGG